MVDEIMPVANTTVTEKQSVEGVIVQRKSADQDLIEELSKGKGRKYIRLVMAALSSTPWVGALVSFSAEADQQRVNDLLKLWVEEYRPKYEALKNTLSDIMARLDQLGEETQERIESPEYLALVRSAFKAWDDSETEEKREYIKRLISNAAATKLVPDDLIRLFIGWINTYHESHFAVIKQVYKRPGITRGEIWDEVNTRRPEENSAEADLFKYLITQLSLGHVIRQARETNDDGSFVKKTPTHMPRGANSRTLESAFEDTKPLELTKLGEQFIHYVLSDVVSRIEG